MVLAELKGNSPRGHVIAEKPYRFWNGGWRDNKLAKPRQGMKRKIQCPEYRKNELPILSNSKVAKAH